MTFKKCALHLIMRFGDISVLVLIHSLVMKKNLFYYHIMLISLLSSGGGRGLIALYEVECTGGEFELADCLHGNWGEHDEYCRHVDDVGISCISEW